MHNTDHSIYNRYIDNFIDNLQTQLYKTVNINLSNSKPSEYISTIKIYLNLLTFTSNCVYYNVNTHYFNYAYNSYYAVNVPVKINFNNFKTFTFNYNIINIPKLTQTGNMLLNGHSRIPIIYLTLVVKQLNFSFNNTCIVQKLIRLQTNCNLYIYYIGNKIFIYCNSYKISVILFSLYNIIICKNNPLSCSSLDDIMYIFSLEKKVKFKLFNDNIFFNKFLYNNFYIEIFSLIYKFINKKCHKKHIPTNDQLINKFSNSMVESLNKFTRNGIKSDNLFTCLKFFEHELVKSESPSTILFKENLLVNPVIHYANQLNSLAYLLHKFKINIFGYSNLGANKFNVTGTLRQVQSDYLGFINLLNTSDGETCGLISTLTHNTILDSGKLKLVDYTCFFLEKSLEVDIVSLQLNTIISNNKYKLKKNKIFKINTVEILENMEFKLKFPERNTYNKNLSIRNVLSISELIIPFLLNNDPCRSLMGSKMHTQSLPVLYTSLSYVVTKYTAITNLLSSRYVYSVTSGTVIEVDNAKIVVTDTNDRLTYYYLYPFTVLDYNSIMCYKPVVWEGEKVNCGKILAVSNDLKHLEFNFGFNNFVNYSFYNGHEHEDAIVVNKNMVIEDIATSLSFNVYEDMLFIKKFDYIELVVQKILKDNYDLFDIDKEYEYLKYDKYLLPGEDIMFKIQYDVEQKNILMTNISKLLFFENRIIPTSNKFLKIKQGGEGRLVKHDVLVKYKTEQVDQLYKDIHIPYVFLRCFVFRVDKVSIGDKLCGRHGNKGVISKIAEEIDLPYTFNYVSPYAIVSPIGALARINVGQFLEGICGYIGFNYDCRFKAPVNLVDSSLYSNLYIKSLYNSYNGYSRINYTSLNTTYLRDFKTGYKLKNFNLLTVPYYLKLMHTAKSKFHYRTIGSYSSYTQQPLHGKNNNGGQKFGEMEIWALESHGSSYNIRELSLLKTNIKYFKRCLDTYTCSESFKVLLLELKTLLINIRKRHKFKGCEKLIKMNNYT